MDQNKGLEVGFATSVNNYLVYLDGLPSARINDIVLNDQGVRGWISSLNYKNVEAFLLDDAMIKPGELFKKSPNPLSVSLGDYLLGRVINPLGIAIDGKGLFGKGQAITQSGLDSKAPGINQREFITSQLETGMILTDLLLPIGKGQRELIMGDARSGKTNFLIDIIVNQKYTNVVCIYAAIGKPMSVIRNMIDALDINQALPYTVIIASSSTDTPPLIFLTPKTAFAVAEYFQKRGKDVLVILDDMGNHAKIYREMSLLGGKVPGRESYPGDMFYQHAHLVERAGNFKAHFGGGSITSLPIIELNLNDFTTLIPTNLMSMTDGHLLFKSILYSQGLNPSIDISLSITRVGSQTQSIIQKILSSKIKSVLAQASDLKTLTSFGAELSPQTLLTLKQAEIIEILIHQDDLTFIHKQVQVALLGLAFTNLFISKDASIINKDKKTLIDAFSNDPYLAKFCIDIFQEKTEQTFFTKLHQALPKIQSICLQ